MCPATLWDWPCNPCPGHATLSEFLRYTENFACKRIWLFSKIRSYYRKFCYWESRYKERRLHGKVWE